MRDVTAEECVMSSCENIQNVQVCLCVHVGEEEAVQRQKERGERWCRINQKNGSDNVEIQELAGRQRGDLRWIMIVPKGQRWCGRGWVEWTSAHHCV